MIDGSGIAVDGAGSAYVTGVDVLDQFPDDRRGRPDDLRRRRFRRLCDQAGRDRDPGWSIRPTWAAAAMISASTLPWTPQTAPT